MNLVENRREMRTSTVFNGEKSASQVGSWVSLYEWCQAKGLDPASVKSLCTRHGLSIYSSSNNLKVNEQDLSNVILKDIREQQKKKQKRKDKDAQRRLRERLLRQLGLEVLTIFPVSKEDHLLMKQSFNRIQDSITKAKELCPNLDKSVLGGHQCI